MPRRHDPDLLRAVGARISELRHQRHMTQEQLAERAGLQPATVSRCEVGARALSLTNLARVAEVLEVQLGDLVDVDRDAPAPALPEEETAWLNLWRSLPAERRDLAMRTIREFLR